VLEKCIGENRRIYDFLQNDQEFKRQVSTHASSFWDWIVFPRSLRGAVLLVLVRTLHNCSEWKRRRAKKMEEAKRKAAENAESPLIDSE
jgi:CelD/BcsL family acetyltransferase involved in cellulose biosynthesis